MHADRSLPVHRPQAVGTGIAAADDHHALARCRDELIVGHRVPFTATVLLRQVIDREVNAGQVATGHSEIAGSLRAAAQHDRVERVLQ